MLLSGTPAKIVEAGRGVRYGTVKGTQAAFVTMHTAPVSAGKLPHGVPRNAVCCAVLTWVGPPLGLKGTGGVVTFRKEVAPFASCMLIRDVWY